MPPQRGTIDALAFSPAANTLATGGCDGSVKVWNLGSGAIERTFSDLHRVCSIAYSPNGRLLAAGAVDYDPHTAWLHLWDLNDGSHHELHHPKTVGSLSFSADGAALATASGDIVRIWDVTPWL